MLISAQTVSRHRSPGVHIELREPENTPQVKSGIPAFVGFCAFTGAQLPGSTREKWRRITSWQQFELTFQSEADGFLGCAVRGFFENGGESCVIVPVAPAAKTAEALAEPFLDTLTDQAGSKVTGLFGILEDIDDIDLICVPDLMLASICVEKAAVIEAQQGILRHCRKMADRFAILDSFPVQAAAREVPGDVIEHRYCLLGAEGALYFPWIDVHQGMGRRVPPCGHIAGIYARNDAQTGVFKAPANEVIEGVFDLEMALTPGQQAELNQAGVNCLKSSPSRGIRVWGARTLSVHAQEQFISTRRLLMALIRWLHKNMGDLVFESNDSVLRDRIRYRLEGYCNDLFQRGAVKGQSSDQAYYVKCDQELNGLEVRAAGQVIAEVGLAPAAPAEFISVRITQSASGIITTALSLN